jgi:hypothetical protein
LLGIPTATRILSPRLGICAQARRQSYSAQPALEIALVLLLDKIEVLGERFCDRCWKRRVAILVPFAGPDHDLLISAQGG